VRFSVFVVSSLGVNGIFWSPLILCIRVSANKFSVSTNAAVEKGLAGIYQWFGLVKERV